MREIVSISDAPSSPLYNQAVKAGGLVYVSGLVGIDVTTGGLAGPTIREQTRQALANCRAVLRAAGAASWPVRLAVTGVGRGLRPVSRRVGGCG